jgi:hypothetical protein
LEPWAPIAETAQLEGLSLVCLAAAVALLPWLWLPRGSRVSLAVLIPAFCIGLFAVAAWTVGPSGSYAAVADAAGAPTTAFVWVLGLPAVLVVAAVTRLNGAPPRTTRWRLLVALLVGMSNPVASYFIGPMFVGYVSHDDTPWVEVVSTVFLVIASVLVWPSSRPPAPATTPAGEGSVSPATASPRLPQTSRSAEG